MTNIKFVRSDFQNWIEHASNLGFTDFVSPEDDFATELSSHTVWANASSCGVYAWVTENKQAYVGQAVNVHNRLRQHWKNYRDLAYAAFQVVPKAELDVVEIQLINEMQSHYPILNIKFATSSAKLVPFDQVVNPSMTEEFLLGETIPKSQDWQKWPLLENKQQRKFESFKNIKIYSLALSALQIFIERCIPNAPATEVKFWSVTLLYPSDLVFRVNVGQQEVFTLWEDGNEVFARILARKQLSDDWDGPKYETKSYANFVRLFEFERWLAGRRVLECRELVVWLMRHTIPMNSGSHCPQLVRAAFAK